MGTTAPCHYKIHQHNTDRSTLFSSYHVRMMFILAKVSNSSPCALHPTPSCFVEKPVLSMATPPLTFPFLLAVQVSQLKQTKNKPSLPHIPSSHHCLSPPHIQPNFSRAIYMAIPISSLLICSNIQYNMASNPTAHPTESALAKNSIITLNSQGYWVFFNHLICPLNSIPHS